MAQVTLVPWNAVHVEEFQTPWVFAGAVASCLRAQGDGNNAGCGILLGQADSNSLRGYQWRVAGTGAVFSWANRTITKTKVEVNASNAGPEGFVSFAFVLANESLAYAEQVFNGEFALGVGANVWVTLIDELRAAVRDALLADNFLVSAINYNHTRSQTNVGLDAMRVVVDYSDNIRSAIMPSEC